LWLLDEPLNALDSDGAKKLGFLVEHHLENGGAILAASHQRLGGEWRNVELRP
jgi:heme exporter protein A